MSGSHCHPPIDAFRILRDHAGMRWSERPGPKVEVPRHFLETLASSLGQAAASLDQLDQLFLNYASGPLVTDRTCHPIDRVHQ